MSTVVAYRVKDDRGRIATYCTPFFKTIAFQGDDFAILAARWNCYLGLPASDPFYASSSLVPAQAAAATQDPYELMAKGLAATIAQAKQAVRSIRLGVDMCAIPRANVEARRARTIATLRAVIDHADGVRLIDPINLLCKHAECRPNDCARLFFSDMSHLSPAGTERLRSSPIFYGR